MTKKLKAILIIMVFAFVAAAANVQAYDEADHVFQAGNGVGDALIFPLYLANETLKTNIRVINTSETMTTVAKVVFREGFSSCEARDFLIFMTPGDVWTADIVDKNGVIKIVSDDDSSPVVPLEIGMATSCNGYPATFGYVEVYGILALDDIRDEDGDLQTPPIAKDIIKEAFDAANTVIEFGAIADCGSSDRFTFDYDGDTWSARAWWSQNLLAGVEELVDPSAGLVLPMVATALANNCNHRPISVLTETRWDNYGNNSAFEIRAALSKDGIHIPFRNDATNLTYAVLNFPAKLSCCRSLTDDCDGAISACEAGVGDLCLTYDSYIGNDGDCLHRVEFRTTWSYIPHDLSENTSDVPDDIFSPVEPGESRPPFDMETVLFDVSDYSGVGGLDLTAGYSEGWIRIIATDAGVQRFGRTFENETAGDPTNVYYNGTAVIPSYLQAGSGDISWVPATYDCANVRVTLDATVSDLGLSTEIPPTPVPGGDFGDCSYQVISPDMMP